MKVAIFTLLVVIATAPAISLAQTAPTSGTNQAVRETTQPLAQPNAPNATQSQPSDSDPVTPPPMSPHRPDAPTLAELNNPDDSQLSRANIELLAKNNELQRRVDELTTQVNVLVNERGGQLFLYGVISTLVSFILGFILASFVMKRR